MLVGWLVGSLGGWVCCDAAERETERDGIPILEEGGIPDAGS